MKYSSNQTISRIKENIKQRLKDDSSGHDWWHVYRVWKMSLNIAKSEKIRDAFVIEAAALLHDIADYKLNNGNEDIGPSEARKLLNILNVQEDDITKITSIIKDISFKGANVKSEVATLEAKIVQDADRLDAIGAIGIARTFAYGGFKKRAIYEPLIRPTMHNSFKAYKKNNSPTINHFYEKLLLLEKLMNTKYAKRISKKRTSYMKDYLERFYKEWDSKE